MPTALEATQLVTALARTVLIVDDHRSFAEAIAIAIDTQVDLRCVAIAHTATEGLDAALRHQPDVIVVDMRLPDSPGPALIANLRRMRPDVPILALTAFADAANVAAAAQAGACAILRKECSVQEILAGLRSAGEGPLLVDASTLGAMMRPPEPVAPPLEVAGVHLTPREREVLDLLSRAYDAQGIARQLGVSIHTVRGYLKSLLSKLGAHSQLEAVVRAKQVGLIPDASLSPWGDHPFVVEDRRNPAG